MMRRTRLLAAAILALAAPVAGQAPAAAPPAAIPAGADGAKIFAITCAACHLATGLGTEGKVPPLAGSEWVTGHEGRLIRIVLHGLVGDVEVQGEVFNGAMPTWGGAFSRPEIVGKQGDADHGGHGGASPCRHSDAQASVDGQGADARRKLAVDSRRPSVDV